MSGPTYQSVLLPLDALLLVGIRVSVTVNGAGVAAEQAVQGGSDLVAAAGLDGVALGTTGLEQTSTLLSITCAAVSTVSSWNLLVVVVGGAGKPLSLERDEPMTRSPEPVPSSPEAPALSEFLQKPKRSSPERSAASCEAWSRLRRECDSGKCLRRDSAWNVGREPGQRLGSWFSGCCRLLWFPRHKTQRAGT